ncbi:MAG: FAD-binding protein [Bacteroidales bacterium]|nr:FAD-binding protein [Bacteroidales bacterium]
MKFDVVIIGGGLAGMTAATLLQKSGKACVVIARGLSLSGEDRGEFERLGGTILPGDRVISGTVRGNRVCSVRTERLGDIALEADDFILATGKFFSCGLIADMEHVYEPIFGLDVRQTPGFGDRADESFHARQAFLDFGVITRNGRGLLHGQPLENLFVAGEVREGLSGQADAIRQSAEEVSRYMLE